MTRASARLFAIAIVAAAFAAHGVGAAKSPIDGRWKTTKATLDELRAAGVPPRNAELLAHGPGTPALEFQDGTFRGLDLQTGKTAATGTYRLDGNLIRLVFRTGFAVELGTTYVLGWSLYRDRLVFSRVPGRITLQTFTLKPWTRVH